MTIQEIIKQIPMLTLEERQRLMEVLTQSLIDETTAQPITGRVPGLHPGTTWVSDDFDDPLPDAFWLGEE